LDIQRVIQHYYRDQEQKARKKWGGTDETWRLPEKAPERLNDMMKIKEEGDS